MSKVNVTDMVVYKKKKRINSRITLYSINLVFSQTNFETFKEHSCLTDEKYWVNANEYLQDFMQNFMSSFCQSMFSFVITTLGVFTYQLTVPTESRKIPLSFQSLHDYKHHALCHFNTKTVRFSQTVFLLWINLFKEDEDLRSRDQLTSAWKWCVSLCRNWSPLCKTQDHNITQVRVGAQYNTAWQ
jgi:hypothetical protein